MKKQDPYKVLIKLLHSFPDYQLPIVLSVMEALRRSLEEQEIKCNENEFYAHLDSLPEEDKELSDECLKHIAESRRAVGKYSGDNHFFIKPEGQVTSPGFS